MSNVANLVLKELKTNNDIDAEQILAKGIGSSSVEVQFYIDSVKHLGLDGSDG